MPWLYNATRDAYRTELLDGTPCGFLPRKRIYVNPANMSSTVWQMVRSGKLANQGGDPVVYAQPSPPAQALALGPVQPVIVDTSSSHHSASDSVTVDSLNGFGGEKELKAVKKQDDDLEKTASGGPEAVIKGKRGRSKRDEQPRRK